MNKTVHHIGWVVHKETMADAAPVRPERKTAEKTSAVPPGLFNNG